MNIIFYPLRKQFDYTELLFSLRSIEKYLIQPYVVVIASDVLPQWLNPATVVHIQMKEGSSKQANIRQKILACFELCDEMFFMNDDIYLLKPIDPKIYPYYRCGPLRASGESGAKPLLVQLEKLGKTVKHFDGHWPIIYEREKFKEASKHFLSECIIKSMYCNYNDIEGTEYPDCKIRGGENEQLIWRLIADRNCFSTGPSGVRVAVPVLEQLFNFKSKYERKR